MLLIEGNEHYLVELKLLQIGLSGNKKLKGLFKPTQPPWYLNYLAKGGRRLYVVFKLNKGYGVLLVTREFVSNIDKVKYSDMVSPLYQEYPTLKELIREAFSKSS